MACLLTLNTGSSSVKFRLFSLDDGLPLLAGGKISDIGGSPVFSVGRRGEDEARHDLNADLSHESAIGLVLNWLSDHDLTVEAAVHRIVHGGERYARPVYLDDAVIEDLRELSSLAPLHQPHNLAGVEILRRSQPDLPQYGCFDTAFHAGHGRIFHEFALPAPIREKGVKRYGFHGLSYEWIAHCLRADFPDLAKGRVVAAHLGNGASLCAIKGGESIDTTMGMTALDGLPMGTRCGALDAGAVIFMLRDLGMSTEEVEGALYHDSGLKGLSGISNDVKTLVESDDDNAAFALAYFAMKTAQYIAAMAVSMGGMDALIFTGGIGEHAGQVREMILGHLSFMPDFQHHIIPANEERAMAASIYTQFKDQIFN